MKIWTRKDYMQMMCQELKWRKGAVLTVKFYKQVNFKKLLENKIWHFY